MESELKAAELRVAAHESLTAEQGRALYAAYVRRGLALDRLRATLRLISDKAGVPEENAKPEKLLNNNARCFRCPACKKRFHTFVEVESHLCSKPSMPEESASQQLGELLDDLGVKPYFRPKGCSCPAKDGQLVHRDNCPMKTTKENGK